MTHELLFLPAGEADVMMWDSGMTEKSLDDQDLFHKVRLVVRYIPVTCSQYIICTNSSI